MTITTLRLTLVPSAPPLARAELFDRPLFARLLDAHVPDGWPPESIADALPWFLTRLEADPASVGWLAWYAVPRGRAWGERVLVAGGGFKGPPLADGTVEVGYAALPEFQGQGLAGEMVGGLVGWAFTQPAVSRVVADTQPD